ncbi:MAG: YqgE/AlgH family protein [Bacteroidetes bacterium]|nr:YqgE/AlgH family protein [Bacteroidota bacterium]
MKKLLPARGRILISEPFLKDPQFNRTVVLLGQHNDESSVGFVLNRLLNASTDELVPDLLIYNFPLYYGGPVEQNTLHFIHTYGDIIEDAEEISHGIFWGGNINSVNNAIEKRLAKPENFKFFVGYSGWTEGQLDDEIKQKAWWVSECNTNTIFTDDLEDMWSMLVKHLGKNFEHLANAPLDPNWN